MKVKRCVLFLIFIACFGCAFAGQTENAWAAYPVGTPASSTITFGDEYTTPIEIYDAKLSVIEVIRGEKAWSLIKKADASGELPGSGFEYVLARVRFEFAARGRPGDKSYTLRDEQFTAFSSDGATPYPVAKASAPHPRLNRTLHSGETAEGWIALVVARNDPKPVMLFRADIQILSHSGSGPAFRLY